MVRHVILWQLKEEYNDEEKREIKAGIKEGLEGLVGKVPGLVEVHVHTEGLASSNADLMLDAVLENEEALKGYVAIANSKVRPYTMSRTCLDFEI